MAEGKGTITLVHNGEERGFEKKHAENLLRYQEGKGYSHWQIKDNKKYQYKDGSIVRTSNSGIPQNS